MQKTLFIIFFGISSICSGQSLDHKQIDSVLHIYARTNVASADSTLTIMRYLYSQEVVKKDLHLKASIRNELATTLSTLGKRDSACLLYREALNFYSKENDTAGVAMVYNNLAITHYRAGRPDSAMYYRTLDYDFSKATNDSSLIVRSLNGIALLHQYQEQYEKAKARFFEALQYGKKGSPFANMVYTNLSSLYQITNDLDSAYYYAKIVYSQDSNNAQTIVTLASISNSRGNKKEAVKLLRRGLVLVEEKQFLYGVVAIKCNLGMYLTGLGRYDKAFEYLISAEEIAKTIKAHTFLQNILSQKTETLILMGSSNKAVDAYYDYQNFRDSLDQSKLQEQTKELEALFETKLKEERIENLTSINDLNEVKIAQEKTIKYVFAMAAILALTVALLSVFYYLKLKTLNTELEALNTTKNKFFAIIAHDLKGAVSSFSGITAIIKNHLDRGRPERVLKIASEVESSSDQLDGLLSNLLSWSFTQLNTVPYQPEIVDVGALLTGLADSVKIRTESKNIDLKINSHTSAKVFADPNGVLFIIRNLVSNAIKFSPSNSQIELLVTGANKTICISIIDKGIGMSEKEKNSLFNLSLKHSTKGTAGEKGSGLGLILCKEFTELNRGKLTLESEKNKGTTVNVVLPKS